MTLSALGPDKKVLQEYLQDLICNATSLEEVDVLVEALMSLQHAARQASARMPVRLTVRPPVKPLRVIHGKSGS